jgi:primosomal replication protein N
MTTDLVSSASSARLPFAKPLIHKKLDVVISSVKVVSICTTTSKIIILALPVRSILITGMTHTSQMIERAMVLRKMMVALDVVTNGVMAAVMKSLIVPGADLDVMALVAHSVVAALMSVEADAIVMDMGGNYI